MNRLMLIAATFLLTQIAFGHAGHPPKIADCKKECTKEQIETAAPNAIEKLASSGKIAESWRTAKIEKIELKKFAKGFDWVVTLLDEKQAANDQRLYVFITPKGYLNGSNKTGE